jgi:hypothetical protein
MATSAVYVFEYLAGLFFFGLAYWLFNGILPEFAGMSSTGNVYDLAGYIWKAAIVVYLVFGIWYFIIRIKTWKFFNQQ